MAVAIFEMLMVAVYPPTFVPFLTIVVPSSFTKMLLETIDTSSNILNSVVWQWSKAGYGKCRGRTTRLFLLIGDRSL